MLLQVDKYIAHGKTAQFFLNPDHIISIGPGQNSHTIVILTSDDKLVEIAGSMEEILIAFNNAKK